jgi:DNA polymerase-1
MAHLSEDPRLVEAFREGEDIHARTASEIFDADPGLVSDEMRRVAKTVNFGIIYGMGAYGLAGGLKISQRDAKSYIDGYFRRYKKVKEFIDKTVARARKEGFVTTPMGRRRYLPEIRSDNRQRREMAERVAVNTPIQGYAAEIIKIAMIRIHEELMKRSLRTRMILQVHDELIFEVPEPEGEEVRSLVRTRMERAVELSVPLKVEMHSGNNWADVH